MEALIQFCKDYQLIIGMVVFYLLSSVAHALPEPEPGNDKTYRFWYNLAHGLVANWGMLKKSPK